MFPASVNLLMPRVIIASVCRSKQKDKRRGGNKLHWVENQSQTGTEDGEEEDDADWAREDDD